MKDETNSKLDKIIELLEHLQTSIQTSIQTKKRAVKPLIDSPEDLRRKRVETLETLFWKVVNAPIERKRAAYKVPKFLLGYRDKPNVEGVVASVLCNQATLRKVFRELGEGDCARETPLDRVKRTLQESNLVVLPATKLKVYDEKTRADIVLSPGEAQRLARTGVDLPASPGWTTTSRAISFEGISGWVDAPDDPCGARRWDSEAETPVKSTCGSGVSELKKQLIDLSEFADDDDDDLIEVDETP